MRCGVPFILLCCVIFSISSKPLQIEENDANASDETEYEVLSGAPAANLPDREENDVSARVSQTDVSAEQEEAVDNQADSSDNEYQSDAEQRRLRDNAETFPDGKRSSDDSRTLRHQSKKRFENNHLNEEVQYGNDREANNYETKNLQFSVRNGEPNTKIAELPTRNDEGTMLFNRNEVSKIDNKYNNEGLDTSEQAHFFKQYHNTMQTDNKRGLYETEENKLVGNSRERREARQTSIVPNISIKNQQDSDTVAEETAIRNHIKKLSDTELKELLDSLTDEKRQLLKKIIDETHANYDTYDNINKREITKKAGALEENNLVENVQSELNKVQPSSSSADENTESPETPNSDSTTPNKQTESSDTGNTNSDNKMEVTSTSDLNSIQSDKLSSLTSAKDTKNPLSPVPESAKCENKRETNYNDFLTDDIALEDTGLADNGLDNLNSPESISDQEYFSCSQDEKKSQLDNDKVQNQNRDYKRETYSMALDELPDSLKSLEESFPNSYAYGDSASYSGALVRVKRKDLNNVKKRSAGVLPHAKTGYFQYKSESEDADNDEGNEFDDDGFYDVASNLAKNKAIDNSACDNSASHQSAAYNGYGLSSDSPIMINNNNVAKEAVNLGSDTDAVLSGVEGVDENLMYNSNPRNRRNDYSTPYLEKLSASNLQQDNKELRTASEIYMNGPNYQENDAFGPLPRQSEGDLGRYKRIRRLKPSHDSEEPSSDSA
ncbi:hypothetical protein O3G_MSEX008677 [Manduca sexta]|uniref:Uncharacterized protein n=1 Tax=Manduca sexta TaxID=7130 RepID=A0A921ZAM3_MANSE|nr:hypothetical protein O3G_MSEX008677 [Manduca sexta]